MESFFQNNLNSDTLIVLFHGTGGNHYQLLPFSSELFPQINTLSLLGDVGQGKNRRFFAPLEQNKINRDDFNKKTKTFIQEWNEFMTQHKYNEVIFMGYSNGANFILGLLEQNLTNVNQILLLHPSNLDFNVTENYISTSLIITTGANDYLSTPGEVKALATSLIPHFKNVHFELLDSGHEIRIQEINTLKSLI